MEHFWTSKLSDERVESLCRFGKDQLTRSSSREFNSDDKLYALVTNPNESLRAAAAADAFWTVKRINTTPLGSAKKNMRKVVE